MKINSTNEIGVKSNQWHIGKVEELGKFVRGKNITSDEMVDGDIPVISAGLEPSGFHNEANVKGPSITISSSGANAGVVLFHSNDIWAADCSYANSSENIVFLYNLLHYIQPVVTNLQKGSAQPHVYAKDVNKIKINIPPKDAQIKISKILSSYDQLIENNEKRIKVLENMAESIYKEWFVRFRFPGYEKCEFKNKIPSDWNYKKFSEIVRYTKGISYSSSDIECDEGNNLINLKNIAPFGGFRREGIKKYSGSYKESQIVKYQDLIMGVTDMTQDRRTVGHVALIPNIVGVISCDLVKLESNLGNIFLYCLFKFGSYSYFFSQFGNGVNVIHLKPESLKNRKILIPSQDVIDKFDMVVSPLFEEVVKLQDINELLAKQRDALLPRLMNGKLSVEGKEII